MFAAGVRIAATTNFVLRCSPISFARVPCEGDRVSVFEVSNDGGYAAAPAVIHGRAHGE
jgi:hypothetical protein